MIKRVNLSLDRATICHETLLNACDIDRKVVDEFVLSIQDQMMFSCFDGEISKGFISAVTTNAYTIEIKGIAIKSNYQRKKNGTNLVSELIGYARKNEFKIVMVKINRNDIVLKKFFEYHKFFPLDQVNDFVIYILPV